MFSVLVFTCRDPGDATSKVSCCVEPSYCFLKRDFDDCSTPTENELDPKSASFVVNMLLHEGSTHIHSQKKA